MILLRNTVTGGLDRLTGVLITDRVKVKILFFLISTNHSYFLCLVPYIR